MSDKDHPVSIPYFLQPNQATSTHTYLQHPGFFQKSSWGQSSGVRNKSRNRVRVLRSSGVRWQFFRAEWPSYDAFREVLIMRSAGNGFLFIFPGALPCTIPARPCRWVAGERDGRFISFSSVVSLFQLSFFCFQQLPALDQISNFQQLSIQLERSEISLRDSFQQPWREVSVSYSLFQFPSLFDVDGNVCFHSQLEMPCCVCICI